MNTTSPASDWLAEFAACVRRRDLERGRKLFAPEVRSFGTRAELARDLSELAEHQWTRVWFHTSGFRFRETTVAELAADDGSLLCVLALWDSEGLDPRGKPFARQGRCTILLRREEASPLGYVAVHTHFSKTPADEL